MDTNVTAVPTKGPDEWDMQVQWLEVDDLVPNAENPNEQDDATFNALVQSIRTEGWTQPVQAVWDDARGKYEIVAGEHRWRAARVLQCKVPTIPLPPEDFDRDRRDWNLVKDNMLRGKMNPETFTRLYTRLSKRYDDEVLKTLMGFTSEDAFKRVFKTVERSLPPGLQEALAGAKDEIKTIDDLSAVLNRLFRDHGETLDANYMVFSWGTKEVLWIRCDSDLWKMANASVEASRDTGESATDLMKRALAGAVEG